LWTVRKGLNRGPLGLKLDVGVAPEHPRADMPSDVHNHPAWCARFAEGRNGRMAKIMESQAGHRTLDVAHIRLALRVSA
jgi:hypothetical protein